MKFADSRLNSLLDAWSNSSDLRERAEAHNIVFEERLDRQRFDVFEGTLKGIGSGYSDFRRQLLDFIGTYVEVDAPVIPMTFGSQNRGASLGEIGPEQKLVRVENITSHLTNAGLTAADLEGFRSSADPEKSAALDDFLEKWNRARDNRPMFAALKDELLSEIGDPDWTHKLRDRLGLAHYDAAGVPLVVALMEYTVEEVIEESARFLEVKHPICVPTFFDSKPSAQFFPTPKELPAGAPMALVEILSDDALITEIIHPRLTYLRHHIAKVGEITSNAPPVDLRTLRNSHLAALQVAAVRDDFGTEL